MPLDDFTDKILPSADNLFSHSNELRLRVEKSFLQ